MLFVLAFAFIITICGTASAATPHQVTTINSHNNSSVISTLQTHSKKAKKTVSKGDPIITGTVTVKEYDHSPRNLFNATVTVNSLSGRTLAITNTDKNGYYSVNFYSTDPQFRVTARYMGCDPVTNTVTVTPSSNHADPNYYGTSNIQITPKQAWWNGNLGYGSNIYITHYNNYYFAGQIKTSVDGTTNVYNSYCIDIYTNIYANDKLLVNGPLPGTTGDLSNKIDWGAVNYIINKYKPTSNQEGGAIQSAIWALTTVQYQDYNQNTGSAYYHFLTAPNDAITSDGGTAIRNRALEIVSDASAHSMSYPSTISVSPKNTRIANGQPVTITATILDNLGKPFKGATVNFQTTGGILDTITGITDSNGQVFTTLSNLPIDSSVTVTASLSGDYGNLLYDNINDPRQNLVAENILSEIVSDISIINSDVTANVKLSQTANSPVNTGDLVTYTVTAVNNGPNTATGIMINDFVPAGLTGVTVTPSEGTSYYNGVWVIPTLDEGASATLIITGTASASMAGTTTTNTAIRTSQDQSNSLSAVTKSGVYTKIVDVAVSNGGWYYLTAEDKYQDSFVVGNTPVFMWGVRNSAIYDEATGVVAEYIIPKGFEYVGSSTNVGTLSYIYNNINKQGIITWNIGYMPKDGSVMTYVTLRVAKVGDKTSDLTPIAKLKQVDQTDNNSSNDQSTFPIIGQNCADIQVNQSYNTNTNNGKHYVTYYITVNNNGPSSATGVQITDILPAGLTYISHSTSNDDGTTWNDNDPAYNPETTNGIWNIGNFNYGSQTKILVITAEITATEGTIINTATRTARNEKDPNYNNDAQTTYLTISGIYKKIVDVAVSNGGWYYLTAEDKYQDSFVVGNTPVFMWGVRNSAIYDEATGVVAEYIIPKGFEYVGSSTNVGTLSYIYNNINKQGIITWNIGYMPKDGSVMTYVTLRVAKVGDKTSDLTPIAKLKQVDQTDNNSSNDQSTFPIIGQNCADIQVNQSYNTNTNNGKHYVTYYITVNNNGPSSATGVQITDILPAGLTYISHSISNDDGTTWNDNDPAYNPETTNGIWNIGNFNYGSQTKILVITAEITATEGTIINTATRTARNEKDPNYNNDAQTTYLTLPLEDSSVAT
ncbi:Ig-like domain-containing protein [Methanobacterium sp. SMA-27]|uniref:Ig-like domain-containing protein n=1 Tax=Methanobacterium sp. SMA-27 TaxID=1495336 RepID=UPI00064E73AD|nr:Ig-like domain-containing protein [Methanobacterium sp. SMA-27]